MSKISLIDADEYIRIWNTFRICALTAKLTYNEDFVSNAFFCKSLFDDQLIPAADYDSYCDIYFDFLATMRVRFRMIEPVHVLGFKHVVASATVRQIELYDSEIASGIDTSTWPFPAASWKLTEMCKSRLVAGVIEQSIRDNIKALNESSTSS